MLCEYGCGNEGLYMMTNGKLCCRESRNSCPEMRRKNSSHLMGHEASYWKGDKNPSRIAHNRLGKTYEEIFGKDAEYYRAICRENGAKSSGCCLDPQAEVERRAKIRKNGGKNGGYKPGSGRGKKGRYKGYWCDSSWELAWVIYQLEHQVIFRRNLVGYSYQFKNTSYNWYPDFQLSDDSFIEIKGYFTDREMAKINSFEHSLKIIGKEEIKPILEWVIEKYGKDFIRLYDAK